MTVLDPSRPAAAPALPVRVQLGRALSEEVRRWTESVLGWQVVDQATAELVPPAIRLVDAATPGGWDSLPTLLLLPAGEPAVDAARAAARLRPERILAWPDHRDRLAEEAAALLAARPDRDTRGRLIRVGGAAGGVGTTTVALALAGLFGWRGSEVLAVLTGPAPMPAPCMVPADGLRSTELWSQATPVPGVPDTRAVSATEPAVSPVLDCTVVHDVGVGADVDVLVARGDRAGLDALEATTAAVVIVVEGGSAAPAVVDRACGGRRRVDLPWSRRVARAGLDRRVPGGLPGAWLRRLAPLAPTSTAV